MQLPVKTNPINYSELSQNSHREPFLRFRDPQKASWIDHNFPAGHRKIPQIKKYLELVSDVIAERDVKFINVINHHNFAWGPLPAYGFSLRPTAVHRTPVNTTRAPKSQAAV